MISMGVWESGAPFASVWLYFDGGTPLINVASKCEFICAVVPRGRIVSTFKSNILLGLLYAWWRLRHLPLMFCIPCLALTLEEKLQTNVEVLWT